MSFINSLVTASPLEVLTSEEFSRLQQLAASESDVFGIALSGIPSRNGIAYSLAQRLSGGDAGSTDSVRFGFGFWAIKANPAGLIREKAQIALSPSEDGQVKVSLNGVGLSSIPPGAAVVSADQATKEALVSAQSLLVGYSLPSSEARNGSAGLVSIVSLTMPLSPEQSEAAMLKLADWQVQVLAAVAPAENYLAQVPEALRHVRLSQRAVAEALETTEATMSILVSKSGKFQRDPTDKRSKTATIEDILSIAGFVKRLTPENFWKMLESAAAKTPGYALGVQQRQPAKQEPPNYVNVYAERIGHYNGVAFSVPQIRQIFGDTKPVQKSPTLRGLNLQKSLSGKAFATIEQLVGYEARRSELAGGSADGTIQKILATAESNLQERSKLEIIAEIFAALLREPGAKLKDVVADGAVSEIFGHGTEAAERVRQRYQAQFITTATTTPAATTTTGITYKELIQVCLELAKVPGSFERTEAELLLHLERLKRHHDRTVTRQAAGTSDYQRALKSREEGKFPLDLLIYHPYDPEFSKSLGTEAVGKKVLNIASGKIGTLAEVGQDEIIVQYYVLPEDRRLKQTVEPSLVQLKLIINADIGDYLAQREMRQIWGTGNESDLESAVSVAVDGAGVDRLYQFNAQPGRAVHAAAVVSASSHPSPTPSAAPPPTQPASTHPAGYARSQLLELVDRRISKHEAASLLFGNAPDALAHLESLRSKGTLAPGAGGNYKGSAVVNFARSAGLQDFFEHLGYNGTKDQILKAVVLDLQRQRL